MQINRVAPLKMDHLALALFYTLPTASAVHVLISISPRPLIRLVDMFVILHTQCSKNNPRNAILSQSLFSILYHAPEQPLLHQEPFPLCFCFCTMQSLTNCANQGPESKLNYLQQQMNTQTDHSSSTICSFTVPTGEEGKGNQLFTRTRN